MASVIEESVVNLFGGQAVTLEEIKKLESLVNNSEMNKNTFAQEIQANTGNALASGIGLYILGRP